MSAVVRTWYGIGAFVVLLGCAESHGRSTAAQVAAKPHDAGATKPESAAGSAGTAPNTPDRTAPNRPPDGPRKQPVSCPTGTHRNGADCLADSVIAPCQVDENVMHLEGGTFINTGIVHLVDAIWTADAFDENSDADIVDTARVTVALDAAKPWNNRDLDLSTAGTGQPLEVRRYEGATRYPFSISDRTPGLALSALGLECNTVAGWFEIHELEATPGKLRRLLATFEQHCEDGDRDVTLGCVHYVAQDIGDDGNDDSDAGR